MAEGERSPSTIGEALRVTRTTLERSSIEGWDVEARILCEWATGFERITFVTQADRMLEANAWQMLSEAIEKRLAGMPVYRIIGVREFFGLNLSLSKDTLDPRPDTETLVELVLETLKHQGRQSDPLSILDLGTGTGAIGLALAANLPNAHVILTDIAEGALECAARNAAANGFRNQVKTVQSDWFSAVSGIFDVIVSNPPYIPSKDIEGLDREVREHDPTAALDGGPDGLAPYRVIAQQARLFLKAGGFVAVEFGWDQASAVESIFEEAGWSAQALRKDLGGRDRVLLFTQLLSSDGR